MVFGFLKRSKKAKIGDGKNILILDFSEKTIKLPNGELISKNDIISYDPQTNMLVYIDAEGKLKTINLGEKETIGDKLISKFLEKITMQQQQKEKIIFI